MITALMTSVKKTPQITSTDMLMPIVMRAKNITSSNGFFTGFLNLTIESAPIIPNDKAIFPEITFVIVKVITGSKVYDIV